MPLYPPAVQTVMDPWSTHDCRLDWVDTKTIKLSRFGGQYLMINGVRCVIPAAGLTLDVSALNALYYVYATQSGGVVNALIASRFVPGTDNFGMPCLNTDPNQTYVGLFYCIGGVMATNSLVASYWNRKIRTIGSGIQTFTAAETSQTYRQATVIRFVVFPGDALEANCCGTGWGNGVAQLLIYTQLTVNGTAIGQPSVICPYGNGWYCPISVMSATVGTGSPGMREISVNTWINTNGGGAYSAQWQLAVGARWLA